MKNFFRDPEDEGGGFSSSSSSSSYSGLFSEELDGLRVLDSCSYKVEKNLITLYRNSSKGPLFMGQYSEDVIIDMAALDIGLFGDGGDARLSELLKPEEKGYLAQQPEIFDRMRIDFRRGEYAVMKGRKLYKMVSSYAPEPDSPAWKGPELLDTFRMVAYDMFDRSRRSGNGKSNPQPLTASSPDLSATAKSAASGASSDSGRKVYRPSGVTVRELMEGKKMLVADV